MTKTKAALVVMAFLLPASGVYASQKTVRATQMGSTLWSDLAKGKLGDFVVEFREGDELPITFEAEGDFFETKRSAINYVSIKKNFWVRLKKDTVEVSLDGASFKPLSDIAKGSLSVGAGSAENGGIADCLNITFKAFAK